jgi:hypothetical protein
MDISLANPGQEYSNRYGTYNGSFLADPAARGRQAAIVIFMTVM